MEEKSRTQELSVREISLMNMFEDFIGYQSSTVLDEPEREAGTTSIPIPQREESENIKGWNLGKETF